jgi:hypothetical protein
VATAFLYVSSCSWIYPQVRCDRFKVIQDQRAAILLDEPSYFVARKWTPCQWPLEEPPKAVGLGGTDSSRITSRSQTVFEDLWKQIMDLFEDDIDGLFSLWTFTPTCSCGSLLPSLSFRSGFFSRGHLHSRLALATGTQAVLYKYCVKHSSDLRKDELRKTQSNCSKSRR